MTKKTGNEFPYIFAIFAVVVLSSSLVAHAQIPTGPPVLASAAGGSGNSTSGGSSVGSGSSKGSQSQQSSKGSSSSVAASSSSSVVSSSASSNIVIPPTPAPIVRTPTQNTTVSVTQTMPLEKTASKEITKTVPLTAVPPTTPVPTLSGKDLIDAQSQYFVAMVVKKTNVEFSKLVDSFAASVVGPALLTPGWQRRVILLGYCSLDSATDLSGDWANTRCQGQAATVLDATLVRWTFSRSQGTLNYSSSMVDKSKLDLFPVAAGSTSDYYQVIKYVTPQPTTAPTLTDRAKENAAALLLFFFIFILLGVCLLCGCYYCNNKEKEEKERREARAAIGQGQPSHAERYGVTDQGPAVHQDGSGGGGGGGNFEMTTRREDPPAPGPPTMDAGVPGAGAPSVAAPTGECTAAPLPDQSAPLAPTNAGTNNGGASGGNGAASTEVKHDSKDMDLQY